MTCNDLTYITQARIPTNLGEFQLLLFKNNRDNKEHLAFIMGELDARERVLTRVHSECFTGDVLGSTRCDCGSQLHSALEMIEAEGRGILIYLRQEGRGIGLTQKLRAYNLQDQGHDTVDANLLLGHKEDEREYGAAAAILDHLQVRSIRLLTNNPTKIKKLCALGIQVVERVAAQPLITASNSAYLQTKIERMGHLLTLDLDSPSTGAGVSKPRSKESGTVGANTQNEQDIISSPNSVANQNGTGHHTSRTVLPIASHFPSNIAQQVKTLQQRAHAHFAQTGLPFVTISYAQSLDGSIAAAPGHPMALSSPESMKLTHALRASHDAILVGINTVTSDNPRLNVRLINGPNPQPVVVDSRLRISTQARLFDEHAHVWVAATKTAVAEQANAQRLALEERGAKILALPTNQQNQVDLKALLQALGERNIQSLMIEGGAHILTSILSEGLAHFAVVTIAPVYVGGYRMLQPQCVDAPSISLLSPTAPPRLANPIYTPMESDLVVWGQFGG